MLSTSISFDKEKWTYDQEGTAQDFMLWKTRTVACTKRTRQVTLEMSNKVRLQSILFWMPNEIQYPNCSVSAKMSPNMILKDATKIKLQKFQILSSYYHHDAYETKSTSRLNEIIGGKQRVHEINISIWIIKKNIWQQNKQQRSSLTTQRETFIVRQEK